MVCAIFLNFGYTFRALVPENFEITQAEHYIHIVVKSYVTGIIGITSQAYDVMSFTVLVIFLNSKVLTIWRSNASNIQHWMYILQNVGNFKTEFIIQ